MDSRPLLLLLLPLLLLQLHFCRGAFQSDELSEDDDEWGFVGAAADLNRRGRSNDAVPSPSSSSPTDSNNRVEFPLEHSFGASDFRPAGTFTARLRPSFRGGQMLVKLRLSRFAFSEADQAAFQELLKEDGFYSIRLPANPLTPGKSLYVVASTKARCLALADLKERLHIYMDQGSIIAVSYNAGGDCPYPRKVRQPSKWSFNTVIFSKSGEQASRTLFVNDMEVAASEGLGLGGDEAVTLKKPPERSFWAKYWMYIIPLGLIVMNAITQVANLQEEQPGQQAGAAAQQQQQQVRRR